MHPIRLAVIIVSYNVRNLLAGCLRSIQAASQRAPQLSVETVVVDNASSDDSAAMVADLFPDVHVIASTRNLGFTGGNNAALRWLGFSTTEINIERSTEITTATDAVAPARADYVLLLNPDAELTGDALEQMVGFLEAQPDVAVCGAGLRYGNGAFQHSAFRFPGVMQVALDLFPPSGLRGAHRLLDSSLNGRYPAAWWARGKPFAVDFVLGAAMMVRGAAIDVVGGLDDEYWMYCEEMDWCRRMGRAGWSVYVLPSAQIVHHEAQSSRQRRWSSQVQLWRSRFRFYAKHADLYAPGARLLLRLLVRVGMAHQARQIERSFTHGEIDGVETERALAACVAIAKMS
jgi:GT2 family glycosyltransferase